jgi:hypothetical protein
VQPVPLPDRHPVPVAPTARRPRLTMPDLHPRTRVAEATDRADPVVQAALVAPADPATTDPVDLVDPADQAATVPADQVDLADPATTDPVDLVGQATTDPAGRVDPATTDPADPETTDRAGQAVLGTATTIAATSTAPPGETAPRPGAQVSHPGRAGTGRFPRPVDSGTMARSTTTATRRIRCGIPGSTSGASTSSEYGSRCNESPHKTPASPIGEAGVARFAAHNWVQIDIKTPGQMPYSGTNITRMSNVALDNKLVLPRRRSSKVVAALVAAMLVSPAPLGYAAPGPPPQPPVPVITGHHRHQPPPEPPPAPPEAPPPGAS